MFKFSLQPVLALKEKIEDSKKRELGIATTNQERIYQEKVVLEQKKLEILQQVRNQENQSIDILKMKACNQYNQYMEQAISLKSDELNKAKNKVAEKRQELLEAVKERKILDNLKTIYQETYEEEEKRDEQRVLDDMVTYRFGKKEREWCEAWVGKKIE